MNACPVGKLGRHDMRIVGDLLVCRYCPATRKWPGHKKMPTISLQPREMGQTWR